MTEETLRGAAVACLENARSLYDAAKLLVEHGHDALAVGVSIIGLEEFSKAVAFTVAALVSEEADQVRWPLKSHEVKHLVASVAEGAQIVNGEGFLVAYEEAGYWPSAEQRLAVMFRTLAEKGLRGLVTSPQEAREHFDRLQKEFPSTPVGSELKNAAFYVDVTDSGEILIPDRVADQATSEILGLEWFFAQFHGLREILINDAAWGRFVRAVHPGQGM